MDTRVHMAARVTPAERLAVRRAALDLGVSAASLIRRALREYLDRLPRDPATRPRRDREGRGR